MSLAITVDLLTGRYVATAPSVREQEEWPPHPARLFSAMVAALHEIDAPSGEERHALEWLERQSPPSIVASDHDVREALTHFVPVNDTRVLRVSLTDGGYAKVLRAEAALAAAGTDAKRRSAINKLATARDVTTAVTKLEKTSPKDARRMLPEHRSRQARSYPSVTPRIPSVTYRWDEVDPPPQITGGLDTLLQRVTRLGHSSTLVWARLDADPDDPTFVPDIDGDRSLRTTGAGQLAALERRFAERAARSADPGRYQDDGPRHMPAAMTTYRTSGTGRRSTAHQSAMVGDWLVFEQDSGPRIGIRRSRSFAEAVRGALLRHAPVQHPLISGHRPDGSPVTDPHLAILPLPFVAHPHANGIIMGVALVLPATSPLSDGRDVLLDAIGRWEQAGEGGHATVYLSGGGRLHLNRTAHPGAVTLQRRTWAGPATTWTTATPVALDRFPKHWGHRDEGKRAAAEHAARATVADACLQAGLPFPTEVAVTTQPLMTGTEPARAHPPFVSGKGDRAHRRLLLHCTVSFGVSVEGPLLLGAGRHLGLGLLRPLREATA
jgi:CRISPR-associated protein Csb2